MTGVVAHTVRALRWRVPATAIGLALALGSLVRIADLDPSPVVMAALAGGLAATVALNLDDPAHALLEPVPVGPLRRVTLRVALLVPPAVAGWLGFAVLGRAGSVPGAGNGLAGLLALAAVGVATVAVVARTRPDAAAAAGAAAVLAWACSPAIVPSGILHDVAIGWVSYPAAVLVASGSVFALAIRA